MEWPEKMEVAEENGCDGSWTHFLAKLQGNGDIKDIVLVVMAGINGVTRENGGGQR